MPVISLNPASYSFQMMNIVILALVALAPNSQCGICSRYGILEPVTEILHWRSEDRFVDVNASIPPLRGLATTYNQVLVKIGEVGENLDAIDREAADAQLDMVPGGSLMSHQYTYTTVLATPEAALGKCNNLSEGARLITLGADSDRLALNELMTQNGMDTTLIGAYADLWEKGGGLYNLDWSRIVPWSTSGDNKRPETTELKESTFVPVLYKYDGTDHAFRYALSLTSEYPVLCQEREVGFRVSHVQRVTAKHALNELGDILRRVVARIMYVINLLGEPTGRLARYQQLPEVPRGVKVYQLGQIKVGTELVHSEIARMRFNSFWNDKSIDHIHIILSVVTTLDMTTEEIFQQGLYFSLYEDMNERDKRSLLGSLLNTVSEPLSDYVVAKVTKVFKDSVRRIVAKYADDSDPIKVSKVIPVMNSKGESVDLNYVLQNNDQAWGVNHLDLKSCDTRDSRLICGPRAFANRQGVPSRGTGEEQQDNIQSCVQALVGNKNSQCDLVRTSSSQPHLVPALHCTEGTTSFDHNFGEEFDLINSPSNLTVTRKCDFYGKRDFLLKRGHNIIPKEDSPCSYFHNGTLVYTYNTPGAGSWNQLNLQVDSAFKPQIKLNESSSDEREEKEFKYTVPLLGRVNKTGLILLVGSAISISFALCSATMYFCPLYRRFIRNNFFCCCDDKEDGETGCDRWRRRTWSRLWRCFGRRDSNEEPPLDEVELQARLMPARRLPPTPTPSVSALEINEPLLPQQPPIAAAPVAPATPPPALLRTQRLSRPAISYTRAKGPAPKPNNARAFHVRSYETPQQTQRPNQVLKTMTRPQPGQASTLKERIKFIDSLPVNPQDQAKLKAIYNLDTPLAPLATQKAGDLSEPRNEWL